MRNRTARMVNAAWFAAGMSHGCDGAVESDGGIMEVARRSIAAAHVAAAMHLADHARRVVDDSPVRLRSIDAPRAVSPPISPEVEP